MISQEYYRQIQIGLDITSAKDIYEAIYGQYSTIETDVNVWLKHANELKTAWNFENLQELEKELITSLKYYEL